MREKICFYIMQTHVLFIFSLVLLWFNTTAATSLGHKPVVAAGGATNTCIDNEREALLGFKARLLDPDDLLSTWRPEEEEDCCNWSGVTCDNQTGHVTMLDLCDYRGRVGGEISISLLNLTYLNQLDLSFCSFHGTIPPFIGSMTHLTYLGLSDNEFTGTIPTFIGNMTELISLQLSFNQFTEGNQLVGTIPLSISYLTNLTGLYLGGNSFDGNLSDFLNNLSRCTSPNNQLYWLDASNNQLTGSLSDEIQNFSSLVMLNLDSNQLNGTISDKLWQLPTLYYLDLSSNSLRGVISENIGKSNLLSVNLSHNSLEGAFFNDDVSNLSMSVEHIDFSSNKLGPRFPKLIQKMKNLMHLDLSNNSISDTIPTEFWNQWRPSQLYTLDLSFNNISGKLPESLSSPELKKVDLSSNSFYGPIPTFPPLISYLDLSRNKFQGGISFLCQIYENFESLDLSHNSLTGQLPDCLKNLTHLKILNLG